uniref:Regulator of MON1-CCZ1 complex N-terminal domain-containing protein n=1 Tax=Tetranychus urticae TaxID=32264 RepID=T1K5U1_TETUR
MALVYLHYERHTLPKDPQAYDDNDLEQAYWPGLQAQFRRKRLPIENCRRELLETSKTSTIIGYVWTSGNEIVFVTDSGVEYYEINRTRNCCRLLKSFNITINWFIYQPVSSFLILSSSQNGNLLQPFHFKSSTMYKLTKFEVEWSKTHVLRLRLTSRFAINIVDNLVVLFGCFNELLQNCYKNKVCVKRFWLPI